MPIRSLLATVVLAAGIAAAAQAPYPATRRVDSVDVLHGVRVPDPYRWLEDLESPETRAWVAAQDGYMRRWTDGGSLGLQRERIERLADVRRYSTPIRRADRWFFFETDANGISGRVLMTIDSPGAKPRPLIDLRARGSAALSRLLAPSPDGKWVAYSEALEGSRWLRLRLFAPAAGTVGADVLEHLHSSSGSIAWLPDGRSFYYVRFAPPTGGLTSAPVTAAAVMHHVVGTPQTDDALVFELGGASRLYAPSVTDDGRWLVITTSLGAGGPQQVFVRDLADPGGTIAELFAEAPGRYTLLGGRGRALWFLTTVEAPRSRIVQVDPRRPAKAAWRTIVAEPDAAESLTYANLVAERLIVMSTRDAAPRVRIYSLDGTFERDLPLPPLSTVWGASGGGLGFVGRITDRDTYFTRTGIGDPGSIYRLDPQSGDTTLFLRPDFGFDPAEFVGRQVFYPARDGTKIPMFLAYHKRVPLDGRRPVFMYGYGALNWSAFPWFQPHVLSWMESGGVYALPGLRGGGEYGERWHQAGVRERKQTSVDDFIAAADWLMEQKVAAAGKVVANGGSISGAVAAAAVVQRPDLFGAAVIDIPALDLLRYDRHSGAAAWIPEFGSPAVPAEFHALRAWSPYHNLKPGVCYPPTLVLAGERDDVAVPSHAYKFVAQLQHVQNCGHPALLQVAWGAGHTFGTSNRTSAETWARQLVFLSRALGLDLSSMPPS